MEKPKLYIKNEKGRYEEYKEPQRPPRDNALYVRRGRKYIPHDMLVSGDFNWNEGVFVVTKDLSAIKPDSWTSAGYLQEIFKLYKASDLENVSIAKLGGMLKLAQYLRRHWDEVSGDNAYERRASIVAILMNYDERNDRGK